MAAHQPEEPTPLHIARRGRARLEAHLGDAARRARHDAAPHHDVCVMLDALDEATKGRANLVRSCRESSRSGPEQEALGQLLRAITEQRKRLRSVRRLWLTLDPFETVAPPLVEATRSCVEECEAMAEALEPWRDASLREISRSRERTLRSISAFVAALQPLTQRPQA